MTWYIPSGEPGTRDPFSSADIRAEFDAIASALEMLPDPKGPGDQGFSGGTWADAILTSPSIIGGEAAQINVTANFLALENLVQTAPADARFQWWYMGGIGGGGSAPYAARLSHTGVVNLHVDSAGNTGFGDVANARAAAATGGFPILPKMAGAPTGVPHNYAGGAPVVFYNNKLYAYNGSAWVSTGTMT